MKLGSIAALLAVSLTPGLAAADETAACLASYEQAQQSRKESHLLDARRELSRCAADACPAIVRRDCLGWLRDLEPTIPSVVVSVRTESGVDLLDASVSVDGGPPQKLTGAPIELDPGPHELVAGTAKQRILVNLGERHRQVLLLQEDPRPPPPSARKELAPWLLGGAALVLAGTGAVLWGLGTSELHDLRDSCGPFCRAGAGDAAQTKLVVGDVAMGLGVLAAAGAIYLSLRPSKTSASPALGRWSW